MKRIKKSLLITFSGILATLVIASGFIYLNTANTEVEGLETTETLKTQIYTMPNPFLTENFTKPHQDFTETPPSQTPADSIELKTPSTPLSAQLVEFIKLQSDLAGIDWRLVMAVIEHESGFNPNAISATNDYGLMQINKIHQANFEAYTGEANMLEPFSNVLYGIHLLKEAGRNREHLTGEARERSMLLAYQYGEGGAYELYKRGVFSSEFTEYVLARKSKY